MTIFYVCNINVKRVGPVLHNYHDATNVFPPAFSQWTWTGDADHPGTASIGCSEEQKTIC